MLGEIRIVPNSEYPVDSLYFVELIFTLTLHRRVGIGSGISLLNFTGDFLVFTLDTL